MVKSKLLDRLADSIFIPLTDLAGTWARFLGSQAAEGFRERMLELEQQDELCEMGLCDHHGEEPEEEKPN